MAKKPVSSENRFCQNPLSVPSLILPQAKPVGWSNWLEELELDLICVLNQAAEAEYSVLASDWSGGEQGGKEGGSGC